jgi:hypothetical protein
MPATSHSPRNRGESLTLKSNNYVENTTVSLRPSVKSRKDQSPRHGGQSPQRKHSTPARSPARRRRRSSDDESDVKKTSKHEENWSSVVKVFCIHCEPNYALPWTTKAQNSSTSTGFAFKIKSTNSHTGVDERWLLTNAHSVQHAAVVQVRRRGSDTKHVAKVLCVGEDCDMALLTVDDPEVWGR